jgi:hypothetical protein
MDLDEVVLMMFIERILQKAYFKSNYLIQLISHFQYNLVVHKVYNFF